MKKIQFSFTNYLDFFEIHIYIYGNHGLQLSSFLLAKEFHQVNFCTDRLCDDPEKKPPWENHTIYIQNDSFLILALLIVNHNDIPTVRHGNNYSRSCTRL